MAKTHEQYVEELKNINPSVRILGRYTKAVERIKVECLLCQKVWEPKVYQLLQGQSCSHCSAVACSISSDYAKIRAVIN